MNTPVVVGVDGTGRSLRALLWAAHDAFLRVRPLRIVHTLPRYEMDIPIFPPGRFEEAESHGRSVIEEAVALVRQAYPDVQVATDMPMSTPAAAMITGARGSSSPWGSRSGTRCWRWCCHGCSCTTDRCRPGCCRPSLCSSHRRSRHRRLSPARAGGR